MAFAPKEGLLTLEAVLTKRRQVLAWRELRDRGVWEPGWVACPQGRPRVLVIGAGLAGLTCAAELRRAGFAVTTLDKARGAGGRASTRRAGELRFDHGAQFFTAREPRFRQRIESWELAGSVARWREPLVRLRPGEAPQHTSASERWVGLPKMSSLVKDLASAEGVEFGVRIQLLRREAAGWFAESEEGNSFGPFEQVVIATPAPQAAPLLAEVAPGLAARVAEVRVAPCWAALVEFREPLAVEWAAAEVTGSPLSWIAHDSSKPGRLPGQCWVLQASPAWSEAELESEPEQVAQALLEALREVLGRALPGTGYLAAHRWRYARTLQPLGEASLFDPKLGIGVCGDGCLGPRLEDAFLSGLNLGERIVASMQDAKRD